MPPLEPKGHEDTESFFDFFDHSANDVALRAATVLQLQCLRKYKYIHALENVFQTTEPWWEIGGANDFNQVSRS